MLFNRVFTLAEPPPLFPGLASVKHLALDCTALLVFVRSRITPVICIWIIYEQEVFPPDEQRICGD